MEQAALRSDITLFLNTRGQGQWFTADQLYAAMGLGTRRVPLSPADFAAFLKELWAHKVVRRWRSEGTAGHGEMYGLG